VRVLRTCSTRGALVCNRLLPQSVQCAFARETWLCERSFDLFFVVSLFGSIFCTIICNLLHTKIASLYFCSARDAYVALHFLVTILKTNLFSIKYIKVDCVV
jgi:hypothetical protein